MACWLRAQIRVNSATRVKTCPHYDITQRKPHTQSKNFFFSIWTRRPAESAEGLNSSIAQSAGQ